MEPGLVALYDIWTGNRAGLFLQLVGGLLTAGCHGNLPVLNLLSASVAKNQHFRPCRKNYVLDRKMIATF